VHAIVTGRLASRENGLSLQIELVDTRDSRLLWGQRYERGRREAAGLEEAVAREVASVLNVQESTEEEGRVGRTYTANEEAYEAFLRGRAAVDRFTEDDVKRALPFFERAVELDREYALAHAWIGMSYFALAQPLGGVTHHEGFQRARIAALRAVEIDPSIGLAHAVLGSVYLWYDWKWEKAREESELATRLDPNDPWAWSRYSWYFTVMGRHDRAIAISRRAVELSPIEPLVRNVLAQQLSFAGRHSEAAVVCLEVLELNPDYRCGYANLRWVYEDQKDYDKAVETHEKAQSLRGGDPEKAASLRKAYEASGPEGYWRFWLEDARQDLSGRESCEGCVELHIRLGQLDEALEELERSFENRDGDLIFLA